MDYQNNFQWFTAYHILSSEPHDQSLDVHCHPTMYLLSVAVMCMLNRLFARHRSPCAPMCIAERSRLLRRPQARSEVSVRSLSQESIQCMLTFQLSREEFIWAVTIPRSWQPRWPISLTWDCEPFSFATTMLHVIWQVFQGLCVKNIRASLTN